jgi:hypothetical protein
LGTVVIGRLTKHYEAALALRNAVQKRHITKYDPSNPEFRIVFWGQLKKHFLCFRYGLPGKRVIGIGHRTFLDIAVALVRDFTKTYFDEDEKAIVLEGLHNLLPLFDSDRFGELFVGTELLIIVIVYFSILATELANNAEGEVLVSQNGSLLEIEQPSPFGEKLAAVPATLKRRHGSLGELFGNSILRHIDLVLTRCVRSLHVFGRLEPGLRTFPDVITDVPLASWLTSGAGDDTGIFVSVETTFSPCFIAHQPEETEETESTGQ